MQIEFENLRLKISTDELKILYYSLRDCIWLRIQNHWKNHEASFTSGEDIRLAMLKQIERFLDYDIGDAQRYLEKTLEEEVKKEIEKETEIEDVV